MNFDKIKQNYPKAYKAFKNWDGKKFYGIDQIMKGNITGDIRQLYDFFDEHGIFVEIKFYTNEPEYSVIGCYWEIKFIPGLGEESSPINEDDFNNRKEAEKAAFEIAFEILNNQLK